MNGGRSKRSRLRVPHAYLRLEKDPKEYQLQTLLLPRLDSFFQTKLRNGASSPTNRSQTIASGGIHSISAISETLVLCICSEYPGSQLKLWGSEASVSHSIFHQGHNPLRVFVPEMKSTGALVVSENILEILDIETFCAKSTYDTTNNNKFLDADISINGERLVGCEEREGGRGLNIKMFDPRVKNESQVEYSCIISNNNNKIELSARRVRMLGGTGHRLVLSDSQGTIFCFDSRKNHTNPIHSFSVCGEVEPAKWCSNSNIMIQAFPRHFTSFQSLGTVYDENLFITGGKDDGYFVWDATFGNCLIHYNSGSSVEPFALRNCEQYSFYGFDHSVNRVSEFSFREKSILAIFDRKPFWGNETCVCVSNNFFDSLFTGGSLGHVTCYQSVERE